MQCLPWTFYYSENNTLVLFEGVERLQVHIKSLVVTTIKEYFAIHYLSIPRVIIALNIL